MTESRILVVVGSVRPHRVGPNIAQWVAGIGRRMCGDGTAIEAIDLADWPLAMDAEPAIPAGVNSAAEYTSPLTRAWSETVSSASAIVFVSPQYNWGYPASLKNAIGHLYHEWAGKPALIVTYGGYGGGKCAEQLRKVLSAVKMKPVESMPELTLPRAMIEANSGMIDPGVTFAGSLGAIEAGFVALGL